MTIEPESENEMATNFFRLKLIMSNHSMVTFDRSGNRSASKILLSSLLVSLSLALSASAEQEIRLDLEENAGLLM